LLALDTKVDSELGDALRCRSRARGSTAYSINVSMNIADK
jgi:hypothetical protein